MWNSYVPLFRQAASVLGISLAIHSTRDLEDNPDSIETVLGEMKEADIILLYRTGSLFWEGIEDKIKEIGEKTPIVSVGYEVSYFMLSNVDPEIVRRSYTYITLNGYQNIENLLRYLGHELLSADFSCEPPEKIPWEGFYHPDYDRYFTSVHEYLNWYQAKKMPWVGILVSRTAWVTGNCAIEDAMIRGLEEKGLNVIPVFTYSVKDADLGTKGMAEVIEEVFLNPDIPRIFALVKLISFFVGSVKTEGSHNQKGSDRGADILSRLNIPVFQPIISYYKKLDDWKSGPGLSDDIGWSVAMPEFEGVIEPILIGAQTISGEDSGKRVVIPDRIEKATARIARWVELAQKPVRERKVAFILLNSPCAGVEANIGSASRLDALESMARILKRMKEAGYSVDLPGSGEELVNTFLERKAISEFRWTTAADIVRLGGCIDQMEPDRYLPFWNSLTPKARDQIRESWGEPPGIGMVHEGKILITGVRYGNALLCVQPKRGCYGARCDGEVCKILHDPLVPPTHQYLATYYYLSNVFGADVLVHVGTHGNLEFLPGKGVGLSEDCYPDIAIGDIPHLYIYNSDNPAEGTIAKRRSYATLVDHMQSVMTAGGLYEGLEDLDRILTEYETAQFDRARSHALQHEIVSLVQELNLNKEVPISHDTPIEEIIPKLHEVLTRIRLTKVPAGMHIFGSVPAGEEEYTFISAILSYESGPSSLRSVIASGLGYDLNSLVSDKSGFSVEHGVSNGTLLERIEDEGKNFIRICISSPESDPVMSSGDESARDLAKRILDIHQRITESKEIDSLLGGFSGRYMKPGPSGLITRGREDVLPAGRNFYSLDPYRLPTKAAFKVGRQLAHALLQKYVQENGSLPESVAFYWMANDVMWTDGEALAQMFALLGVEPKWQSNGRVKGFSIIPLEILGRPRIDLAVRCSGVIRDNFSNLIDLLDEVVDAVAGLHEPPEDNFVRKHVLESMKKEDTTWRDATLRIFSSRPGTYTSGVNLAVYASAWKDESDLADIFLAYCGFGYGRDISGAESHLRFAERLSEVDVTFNKMPSDEYDLLGCCCYFSNQGGMTAAARQLSGKDVHAYFGDTREADHAEVRDLADEVRRVVRGKLLNPVWIEGLKEHGYAGASEMAKRIGRVYGWEATTREVDDWIFDEIAETFVNDPEMKKFFEETNPYAFEEISRRLLEAHERGLWNADPEVFDQLKRSYLEIESWMEEQDHEGEFQGGSVDIIGRQDVERWDENMLRYLDAIHRKRQVNE